MPFKDYLVSIQTVNEKQSIYTVNCYADDF
jgi:hypothetical protein